MRIKDISFEPHPAAPGKGTRALVNFPNGFSASIITGEMFYSRPECPYEIAVLKDGSLHYENPVARGDVRGYLTEEEADKVLVEIEALTDKDIEDFKAN